MCDVLFITPNTTGDMAGEVVGPLILATILKNEGVSCEILQFCRIGDVRKFDDFLNRAMVLLEEKQPKIVSFYTRCDSYHIQIRLAQLIKARWENIYVVFGGPQSDITAEETLRQIPCVDFICCGEGETTVYPFFSSLLAGQPDLTVAGLVYRLGGGIQKNPRPDLIQDLNLLPMIDYSFFYYDESRENAREKGFPIDVGRGCPFGCTYCSTKTFWGRRYRVKSPERICEEIQYIHNHFGMNRFGFSHDMFTVNRNKVIETCKLLKQLDFPIKWSCSARLDCIDRELIDYMADSGMVSIFIGIETGSPRMQKLINKNLKLDNAEDIIGYLKAKGIKTTASFIYGFPEETEEDLSATISMIGRLLQMKTVKVQTHLCTFLAGTELSDRYSSEMTPVEKYSDITGEYAIQECADLIQEHPELFSHMLEYKTEFRTKLEHFKTFMTMWYQIQPVYQYFSEKYPPDQLIQMYYDFVEANREKLDTFDQILKGNGSRWLIGYDCLPDRFSEDENLDIIKDMYRYRQIQTSEEVKNGGNVSDVFCFDPSEMEKFPLQEITRCVAMANWHGKKFRIMTYPL